MNNPGKSNPQATVSQLFRPRKYAASLSKRVEPCHFSSVFDRHRVTHVRTPCLCELSGMERLIILDLGLVPATVPTLWLLEAEARSGMRGQVTLAAEAN